MFDRPHPCDAKCPELVDFGNGRMTTVYCNRPSYHDGEHRHSTFEGAVVARWTTRRPVIARPVK